MSSVGVIVGSLPEDIEPEGEKTLGVNIGAAVGGG